MDGSLVAFLFGKLQQFHKNILPENAISTTGGSAGKHLHLF